MPCGSSVWQHEPLQCLAAIIDQMSEQKKVCCAGVWMVRDGPMCLGYYCLDRRTLYRKDALI
jgi:hypothetical protein